MATTLQSEEVKVSDHCHVSPPPGSVPTTSLPLTFLDIAWFLCCPVERILLYDVSLSSARFSEEVLPQLKHSLSLALQRFFPFSGNLVCPPQPAKEPYILYKDGDSVDFLVAESCGSFGSLMSDGLRDAKDINQLLPPVTPLRVSNDTRVELTPLLAVQVTLFPNCGFSIGIKYHHVVADGMSLHHFVKTWASMCRRASGDCISWPVHNRELIKDPNEMKPALLNKWREWGSPAWKEDTDSRTADLMEDKVRATFILSRDDIERLKKRVSSAKHGRDGTESKPLHISSFVAASAFIWVCLIRSLDIVTSKAARDEEPCHFVVSADCRNRYELHVPVTYFGNSIGCHLVTVRRGQFRQKEGEEEDDSLAIAAEAIARGIEMFKTAALSKCENVFLLWMKMIEGGDGDVLTVAGSPKLAVYETDFGWGRPKRSEVGHLDAGSISLSDAPNGSGGIEVGLSRNRLQMEAFTCIFRQARLDSDMT